MSNNQKNKIITVKTYIILARKFLENHGESLDQEEMINQLIIRQKLVFNLNSYALTLFNYISV